MPGHLDWYTTAICPDGKQRVHIRSRDSSAQIEPIFLNKEQSQLLMTTGVEFVLGNVALQQEQMSSAASIRKTAGLMFMNVQRVQMADQGESFVIRPLQNRRKMRADTHQKR